MFNIWSVALIYGAQNKRVWVPILVPNYQRPLPWYLLKQATPTPWLLCTCAEESELCLKHYEGAKFLTVPARP